MRELSRVCSSHLALILTFRYRATYFVRGVETMSELRISLRRLNAYLCLPEPPPPPMRTPGHDSAPGRGTHAQVGV